MPAASWDRISPFRSRSPSDARRRVFRRGRPESSSAGPANRARCFSLIPPLRDAQTKTPQQNQQRGDEAYVKSGQAGVLLKCPGESDETGSEKAEGDSFKLDPPLQFVEPAEHSHESQHGEDRRNDGQEGDAVSQERAFVAP